MEHAPQYMEPEVALAQINGRMNEEEHDPFTDPIETEQLLLEIQRILELAGYP